MNRLTCQRCVDQFMDFLDGELDRESSSSLEEHLAGCEPCLNFLNTYRTSSRCARRRLLMDELPRQVALSVEEYLKKKIPGF